MLWHFISSKAKFASTLHLFCQNIVCVGAAKELRTDYGGSYRHVERLRRTALGREVRYRESSIDVWSQAFGDTFAFVAHYYQSAWSECASVDVVAFEECAINVGIEELHTSHEVGQVGVCDIDVCHSAHSGLYAFGVVDIGSIGRTNYLPYAKPVGDTHDSTEIACVLYAVEHDG